MTEADSRLYEADPEEEDEEEDDDEGAGPTVVEIEYYQALSTPPQQNYYTPPDPCDAVGKAILCSDAWRDEVAFYLSINHGRIARLRYRCLSLCGVAAPVTADLLCHLVNERMPLLGEVGDIKAQDFLRKLGGPSLRVVYRTGPALSALHLGVIQHRVMSVFHEALGRKVPEEAYIGELAMDVAQGKQIRQQILDSLQNYAVKIPPMLFGSWLSGKRVQEAIHDIQFLAKPAIVEVLRQSGCRFPRNFDRHFGGTA